MYVRFTRVAFSCSNYEISNKKFSLPVIISDADA